MTKKIKISKKSDFQKDTGLKVTNLTYQGYLGNAFSIEKKIALWI